MGDRNLTPQYPKYYSTVTPLFLLLKIRTKQQMTNNRTSATSQNRKNKILRVWIKRNSILTKAEQKSSELFSLFLTGISDGAAGFWRYCRFKSKRTDPRPVPSRLFNAPHHDISTYRLGMESLTRWQYRTAETICLKKCRASLSETRCLSLR